MLAAVLFALSHRQQEEKREKILPGPSNPRLEMYQGLIKVAVIIIFNEDNNHKVYHSNIAAAYKESFVILVFMRNLWLRECGFKNPPENS